MAVILGLVTESQSHPLSLDKAYAGWLASPEFLGKFADNARECLV